MYVPPLINCGCGGTMRPETGNPMARGWWVCQGCGGCVEAWPGDHATRRCGAYFQGVRCGLVIEERRGNACNRCHDAVVDLLFSSPGERRKLAQRITLHDRREAEAKISARKALERKRAKAQQREKRQDDSHNVVYYARLGANHIKVGTTSDLPRRMVELRVVNETNLLAAEPGGYQLERERHEQFRKWRYSRRTEDFAEAPELLAHIADVRSQHGAPYELAARLLAVADLPDLRSA